MQYLLEKEEQDKEICCCTLGVPKKLQVISYDNVWGVSNIVEENGINN